MGAAAPAARPELAEHVRPGSEPIRAATQGVGSATSSAVLPRVAGTFEAKMGGRRDGYPGHVWASGKRHLLALPSSRHLWAQFLHVVAENLCRSVTARQPDFGAWSGGGGAAGASRASRPGHIAS